MKNKYRRMIRIILSILKKCDVPLFLHSKSKHTLSVHQHIILLVLGQYESKNYERFAEWLEVATEAVILLQLRSIPHFATLQKAAARISEGTLHTAIGGSLESHHLEKYLRELMQLDLKINMQHRTIPTGAISGTHLQNALQDLT